MKRNICAFVSVICAYVYLRTVHRDCVSRACNTRARYHSYTCVLFIIYYH